MPQFNHGKKGLVTPQSYAFAANSGRRRIASSLSKLIACCVVATQIKKSGLRLMLFEALTRAVVIV